MTHETLNKDAYGEWYQVGLVKDDKMNERWSDTHHTMGYMSGVAVLCLRN